MRSLETPALPRVIPNKYYLPFASDYATGNAYFNSLSFLQYVWFLSYHRFSSIDLSLVGIVDFSQEVIHLFASILALTGVYQGKMALHDRVRNGSARWALFESTLLIPLDAPSFKGFEPRELIGRPSLELVHPDEFPRVKKLH